MIAYIDGSISLEETKKVRKKLNNYTIKHKNNKIVKEDPTINVNINSDFFEKDNCTTIESVYSFINKNWIKSKVVPSQTFKYGIKRLNYQMIPSDKDYGSYNEYYNMVLDQNLNIHIYFLHIILFLNDCKDRELFFYNSNESFIPKAGDAICFPSNNLYSNYCLKGTSNFEFLRYDIGYLDSFPTNK